MAAAGRGRDRTRGAAVARAAWKNRRRVVGWCIVIVSLPPDHNLRRPRLPRARRDSGEGSDRDQAAVVVLPRRQAYPSVNSTAVQAPQTVEGSGAATCSMITCGV